MWRYLLIYALPLLGSLGYVGFIAFFERGPMKIFLPLFLVSIPFYLSALLYTVPVSTLSALLFFFAAKRKRENNAVWKHFFISGLWSVIISAAYLISVHNGYVITV